jgi:formylglycine-generating enzyme required for sulfatase activity
MGSPPIATPIMPVDHAAALQQIKQKTAAALQQQAQSRASQAIIDQFKGWQKIGLQGEKLAVVTSQWAAVIDEKTNLMWAINSSKTSDFPNPKEKMTWDEAQAWAKYVNTQGWCGYNNWRLPTIDELKTLLLTKKHKNLYLREDILTDINHTQYWVWSSSLVANSSNSAWLVLLSSGYGNDDDKDINYYVRLVRSSQ